MSFKSEYLFRTFSVFTKLVTSVEFYCKILCYYAVPFLVNYGAVPYSLIFTPRAALLQAVLQVNMKPFRNGLVKMREKAV